MGKPIPAEALLDLRRRLSVLPPRSIKQRRVMGTFAQTHESDYFTA